MSIIDMDSKIKELRELMESDELELDTLGDRKTALFIITSDTDPTFDFVTAMIVSQLFNLLCATRPTTNTAGGCPSMCAVCWTR